MLFKNPISTTLTTILTAACFATSLSFVSPVFAQESDAETTEQAAARIANGARFGNWAVSCEAIAVNETSCVLTQRFFRDTDRAFLAQLLAFWSADGEKSYIVARAPSGVHLPAKFLLKDESARRGLDFEWQSCARDVCEALSEVSMRQLKKLEKAEKTIAGYRISLSGSDFSFPVNTNGVVEGLEALKEMQSKPE